jgi:hypothetical protein
MPSGGHHNACGLIEGLVHVKSDWRFKGAANKLRNRRLINKGLYRRHMTGWKLVNAQGQTNPRGHPVWIGFNIFEARLQDTEHGWINHVFEKHRAIPVEPEPVFCLDRCQLSRHITLLLLLLLSTLGALFEKLHALHFRCFLEERQLLAAIA